MGKKDAKRVQSSTSREICKICHHANAVGFHVPDDVWKAAVPEPLRRRVVCLACFARLADEHLVAWDRDIQFFPVSLATHLGLDRRRPGAS